MSTAVAAVHTRSSRFKFSASSETNSFCVSWYAFVVKFPRDPQHHFRLVGHVGGRSARRVEGVQFRPGAGRQTGNVAGTIPRGIFPAVHKVLRPPHAGSAACPAGSNGFTRSSSAAQTSVIELPHARDFLEFCRGEKTPHIPVEHRPRRSFQGRNARVTGFDAFLDGLTRMSGTSAKKSTKSLRENNLRPRKRCSSATWSTTSKPPSMAACIPARC